MITISVRRDAASVISYTFKASPRVPWLRVKKLSLTYESDLSYVPESVLIIPGITSILSACCATGEDVVVENIDIDFFMSSMRVQTEWKKMHPLFKGCRLLIKKEREKHTSERKNVGLLYSSGIDSTYSLMQLMKEETSPILLSFVAGKMFGENSLHRGENRQLRHEIVRSSDVFPVFSASTLRKYQPQSEWWAEVDHSIQLLGFMSPLVVAANLSCITISSTYNNEFIRENNSWGSLPCIDEQFTVAGVSAVHSECIPRMQKVRWLVENCTPVRRISVCTNNANIKEGTNCGKCFKCMQTALAFLAVGVDPRLWGISFEESTFFLDVRKSIEKDVRHTLPWASSLWKEIQVSVRKHRGAIPENFSDWFVSLDFEKK